ncbi:MAG TPA: L-seryl-tRNA(Sec) selenium transferase [Thermoanaerobaculia bacterium]|nr:L-seryl-tRNA(Sec) selenium transferase [Thermoanaerobaculia bacterium]
MRKGAAGVGDSDASLRRSIPSVERILSSANFAPLIDAFSRDRVKNAVSAHLDILRRTQQVWDEPEALEAATIALQTATASTLRRVINATGVIIHTNLGRSPIDRTLWSDAAELVTGYSNLEFDLDRGERGARDEHLAELCRSLFGCEAALLTNNNAAGTLLLLAATAGAREGASSAPRDVLVSRGELVEIGGSFRVPDVIQQGGARLREVGTTNRTRARDYVANEQTAAILRVHRSNFDIVGFTETPSVEELIAQAREQRVPMLYDEGTGRIVDISKYGFSKKETIRELIAMGVDAIACSTDKLIGATQGGLLLGRESIIAKCRKHPLMRAFRAGKESYAIIAETLRAFATERHEQRIPIYRMLSLPLDALRERAKSLGAQTIVDSRCALGGGTTPTETIPSIAIAVAGNPNEQYTRFLRNDPPIAGRIVDDRFTLDMRTLLDEDLASVARALATR